MYLQPVFQKQDNIIPQQWHKRIEGSWKNILIEKIGDYYNESNNKTSDLIGINLKELGYGV